MILHIRRWKPAALTLALAGWVGLAACRPVAVDPAADAPGSTTSGDLATTGASAPAAADPPLTAAPDLATADPSSAALAATTAADPTAADPAGACPARATSADQEGPYYSTAAPARENLREEGMAGRPILISGQVFDPDCRPVPGAVLDFWHADAEGQYDNAGYRLRGRVAAGADGSYRLETISPTAYTGRPPHVHLKVFDAAGKERLTTQLYFPGAEGSADVAQAPDLLVAYGPEDAAGRAAVRFDIRLGAGE